MNYNKELDKIKKQIKKTIQTEETEEIKQKIDSQIDESKSVKTNKQEYETGKQKPKKQDKNKKQRTYDPQSVDTSDKNIISRASIPYESEVIIDNIYAEIERFTPSENWSSYWSKVKQGHVNTLKDILDRAISNNGRDVAAQNLKNSSENIAEMIERIMYSSDEEQIEIDLAEFSEIANGAPLSLEEIKELSEDSEIYETN